MFTQLNPFFFKYPKSTRLIRFVVRFRLFLVKLSKQVGGPVDQIEECEHEREKDARQNVDPFAATWKFVKPGGHEIAFRLLCMDFGLGDFALKRKENKVSYDS